MAQFDITRLTGSTQLIDQAKSALDNLKLVIQFKNTVITDIGVNNDYELGDLMVDELQSILDQISVITKRLEYIQYGPGPIIPCYSGPTGPIGWVPCPPIYVGPTGTKPYGFTGV